MAQDLYGSTSEARTLTLEPAISWSAIIAGAVVGVATSIVLTVLASGFGMSLAYGLASRGSLAAFTPILGAGAIAVQVLSGGLGGYVAGRLRHVWLSAHTDEAHFRDTAHGLIAWALITVVGAVLAATVFAPYADQLAPAASSLALSPAQAARAADIAAQSAFFLAIGMLLSAFIAAVAARLGGLRSEEMHAKRRI